MAVNFALLAARVPHGTSPGIRGGCGQQIRPVIFIWNLDAMVQIEAGEVSLKAALTRCDVIWAPGTVPARPTTA